MTDTDWNKVSSVSSDSTFVEDANSMILIGSAMPPTPETMRQVGVNSLISGWAKYVHTSGHYVISKNVYIVKTADGKYVKLQFINYLNDEDKSGYLSFKYQYQKDGSKTFE